MLDQREIWWGVVAPPVLMIGGLALSASLPWVRRWLSMGMVLGLVYAVGQFALNNWQIPRGNVHDWPMAIALGAGFMTQCAASSCHAPWWWRMSVRVLFPIFLVWLLMRVKWPSTLTSTEIVQAIGLSLMWIAVIFSWERAYKKASPLVAGTGLSIVAILSAVVSLLFNCLTHAQYAGVLAGALVAATALTAIKPQWWRDQSMVIVSAFILPSLWLLGCFYADLTYWAPPLLAVAGLAPWLIEHPRLRSLVAWKQMLVVAVIIGVIVSPIIIWGVITSIRAAGQQTYGY
jgi:hypothetical protein